MDNFIFYIEKPYNINFDDLKNLRRLYLPIIGATATIIYEYLVDISEWNDKKIFNIDQICQQLQINNLKYEDSLNKLEAVGLLKTFKKNDNNNFIYNLIRPHDIENFNKNPLLKSHLIRIISLTEYNKIYFGQKQKFLDKNNYTDISKKYQDIFTNIFEENVDYDFSNDEYQTLELDLNSLGTHDENIKSLSSNLFIKYLMKRNPSFYETQLINSLLKLGFGDSSINLLLDFSYKFNDEKIVYSYIQKIADDFASRSIRDFLDVKLELSVVEEHKTRKKNKTKKLFDKDEIISVENEGSIATTKEISINDIFSDEDIKGIF